MINEPRPYAALSSGLLARKGTARPAMRPQGFTGFEDLGWNDMGQEPSQAPFEQELPEHVPSSIAALTPAPRPGRGEEAIGDEPDEDLEAEEAGEVEAAGEVEYAEEAETAEEPEVVAQQRAIAENYAAESEPEPEFADRMPEAPVRQAPAKVVALPRRAHPAAIQAGRKSAFTLRLDASRHLRLRLAVAVTGQSAQQIVTGALDALLDSIPELDALAERVPSAKAKRN